MVPNVLLYQLFVVALVVICLLIHIWWRDAPSARAPAALPPDPPRRKRSTEPKPFPGFIHIPLCAACVQGTNARPTPPGAPPPVIAFARGRRRTVETRSHFCPAPACSYRGWLGRGNIRANGHPAGQPWRQLQCVSCQGYFSETHGTIFHGKGSSVELIVRVIACLAEGLGIRGTARVFEIDPNTVLGWLVEAAEQLHAFSAYFLHELHLNQVQLDELYAVLRAVRDGDVSETEAIERLSRVPHWVWTAIDPESKLLLSIQVGDRTLAMARRRKEERRAGTASRGMVRRWGRFSPRVRHRVVPDRERVPDRCSSSGSAVDVGRDAPAGTQRAERASDGGVVYVSRALSVSPSIPRIHAQRVARCDPYHTRNCLPPKT